MNQYALAHYNGKNTENLISNVLNVYIQDKEYDGIAENGLLVEIKSCQKYIIDKTHTTRKRRGRFILKESDLKNDYLFIFVVKESESVFYITWITKNQLIENYVLHRQINWIDLSGYFIVNLHSQRNQDIVKKKFNEFCNILKNGIGELVE